MELLRFEEFMVGACGLLLFLFLYSYSSSMEDNDPVWLCDVLFLPVHGGV